MILKKMLLLLLLTFFSLPGIMMAQTGKKTDSEIRVMSYNIRYDNPDDGVNRWTNRREQVANLVAFHKVDIAGMQEVLYRQLQWLEEELDGFKWVGVGRSNGQMEGEFSPIFYNADRFENKDSGTFWLSPTPDEPSVGWDAALPRICTWVKLHERSSGREFMVLNTHFDHIGEKARLESSKVILNKIDELADGDIPVVLTGDFNTEPDSEPYTVITGTLHDAIHQSEAPHYGPEATFLDEGGGFSVSSGKGGRRIDYIFVNDQVSVLRHGIISTFRDGRFPSDHLPVVADITF